MTCHITGFLRAPSGEAMPGASVNIRSVSILATPSGVILPVTITAEADPEGFVAIDMLPGSYRIRWSDTPRSYEAPLSVPDEPEARLEDLLVAAPIPVRGSDGKGWTGGHYDPSSGRVVFESEDGLGFETGDLRGPPGMLPEGEPGQLLGYGPQGAPVALDPPTVVPMASAEEAAAGLSEEARAWSPQRVALAARTVAESVEGRLMDGVLQLRFGGGAWIGIAEIGSGTGDEDGIGIPPADGPQPYLPQLVSPGSLPQGDLYSGQVITLTPPVYDGLPEAQVELEWQWSAGGDWARIIGAGATLSLSESLEGASVRVRHRASNSVGTTDWSATNVVGPVLPAVPQTYPPRLVSPGGLPQGEFHSGQVVTLIPPVYDGLPEAQVELEWQRSTGAGWAPLAETGMTLNLVGSLEGASVRVRHRASNSAGVTDWSATNVVGPVLPALNGPVDLTANGLSITVDGVLAHGLTEDGVCWVKIDPVAGATVTALGQTFRTGSDGKKLDGTVLNPKMNGAHSFSEWAWGYDASAQVSLPLSVQPGDVLITSKGREGIVVQNDWRSGVVLAYGSFIFVEDAPAAGSFAPSPVGWTGRTRQNVLDGFEMIDLDAVVAGLPDLDLSSVSHSRSISDLLDGVGKHNPLFSGIFKTVTNGYEALYPYQFGALGSINYGAYTASVINDAALHLVGDVATTGEKKALLRALVTLGKYTWAVCSGADYSMPGDGGHYQMHQVPALAYLYATGQSTEYANLADVIGGNHFRQVFAWDSTLLAQQTPHDNPDWLHTWRRRVIPEGGVSGNVITLPAYYGGVNPDPGKTATKGVVLVRESDGKEAIPTGVSWPDSNYRYTIDAHPDPAFASGDTIYMRATYAYFEGDPDWRLTGRPSHYHPAADFAYRDMQSHAAFVLFARALEVWDASWNTLERLCARGVAEDEPLPDNDFPTLFYVHPMGRDFWAAHAETLGIEPWDPWIVEADEEEGGSLTVKRARAGTAPEAKGRVGKIQVTG